MAFYIERSLVEYTLIYVSLRINWIDRPLNKSLFETGFEELKEKIFESIHIVEMLCEVCGKPISVKEKSRGTTRILDRNDYGRLLNKGAIHDRAEVDLEKRKIWFYDHDFPGDIHPECLEKL